MCRLASFIVTEHDVYWCASDKHEDIILRYGLCDDGAVPRFVRVEITPSITPRDLSTWAFGIDQDVLPTWTFDGDPDLEQRARDALCRRAQAECWFANSTADHATAGYLGTATAGYLGTATAGNYGTATAGCLGTATAGHHGTATAGEGGTATAGNHGTATAGINGTATAGYLGTATAGNHGTATAGINGTATAGHHGTATAGEGGTATAGYLGMIMLRWFDGARYLVRVLYVGEGGIEPGVGYRLTVDGRPVKAGS